MPSDRSRNTDLPHHGYTGVVAQQGRVILDRDFNAAQGLAAARTEADALDVIGRCGTPDDGFAISAPAGGSPPPAFWSPPVSPPASPPESFGEGRDFLIAPGTMYLGGQRVCWPGRQDGAAITYSYADQPDWPAPPAADQRAGRELVYLDVTEQEVSAVEDPDLLEVALGGPDTTQRLKLLRRVRRRAVDASDCVGAWDIAVADWAARGLAFDPATMRLAPAARVKIGFIHAAGAGDPCDPVATGGYLGADNQMIRLRVVETENGVGLVWGYDNASFIYRAKVAGDSRLTLDAMPPDAFHTPRGGQLVEVLTTAAVLGREPDETDPGKTILRVAAAAAGRFFTLAQSYGPLPGGDATSYIVLNGALPDEIIHAGLPVFLRVWQAALDYVADAPIVIADAATGISTGLTATFAGKAPPAAGAFWQIAVRPATPQAVYPERLLVEAQPPDGPRRWVCPLAVIDWDVDDGPVISDCRNVFDNLVTLTRRKPGCCTVAINPGDVTGDVTLQALIDRAAGQAKQVTVCLGAGHYSLAAPLRLNARHEGMILESCGGPAMLLADPKVAAKRFADGLVVVAQASGITLRGLKLTPPPAPVTDELLYLLIFLARDDQQEEAKALFGKPHTAFGVRAYQARTLTLERCEIGFGRNAAGDGDLIGAGVFLQGDCAGLTVRDCVFASDVTPTMTAMPRFAAAAEGDQAQALPAAAAQTQVEQQQAQHQESPPAQPVNAVSADLASAVRNIIARRRAADYVDRIKPIVATAGILTTSRIGADQQSGGQELFHALPPAVLSRLGQVLLRENRIDRMTLGVFIEAALDGLRLQNNRIAGGAAGFWLIQDSEKFTLDILMEIFASLASAFEEALLLYVFAVTMPLPKGVAEGAVALNKSVDAEPGALPILAAFAEDSAVFLLGNEIRAGLLVRGADADTSDQGSGLVPGSSTAVLLSFGGEARESANDAAVETVSLVVSANRFGNVSEAFPTAIINLPAGSPGAITGNIIVNNTDTVFGDHQQPRGKSLLLRESGDSQGGFPLAITGNVLRGLSDLGEFVRPTVAVRKGWSPYNADPD